MRGPQGSPKEGNRAQESRSRGTRVPIRCSISSSERSPPIACHREIRFASPSDMSNASCIHPTTPNAIAPRSSLGPSSDTSSRRTPMTEPSRIQHPWRVRATFSFFALYSSGPISSPRPHEIDYEFRVIPKTARRAVPVDRGLCEAIPPGELAGESLPYSLLRAHLATHGGVEGVQIIGQGSRAVPDSANSIDLPTCALEGTHRIRDHCRTSAGSTLGCSYYHLQHATPVNGCFNALTS